MQNHKFIFLGGLHRSGTSLLFKCLREHPQMSGFKNTKAVEDEGQHLQSVYPPAITFGGPGRFGFNQGSFMDENSELATSENGEKLLHQWEKYWDIQQPVLLEKSPPNLVRTRFLQKLFPNSFFIVVLRHPIAVSYATKKWCKQPLHSLVEHWLRCYEKFELDRVNLQNVVAFKYENFVANPQVILSKIYSFVELENFPLNIEVLSNVNNKYFSRWHELKGHKIKSLYAIYVESRFEQRINKFGYSLKNLETIE
ncbi:MAG: sulfotransferase [Trichodesmium sp. MAG_R04]|nr:sulfotransferase [Trichodesmium sp. MAG_R04]